MATSKRAPRVRMDTQARHQAILDAALAHYATATYADVAVADVARDAGASPALVHHYFGSKAGLYAAAVAVAIERLRAAQREALDAVPAGSSARDRVRASLFAYLDHIATHPVTWSAPLIGGTEPEQAIELRREARAADVDALRVLLQPPAGPRYDAALWGYFGFVDAACLRWVDAGCPDDQRHPLVEASLGALEGALGDWGR